MTRAVLVQSDAAALQGSHDTTAPAQLTAAFIPAAPAAGASTQPGVLSEFWQQQMQEVSQVSSDPAEFKNHQLPLARIKKVGWQAAGLFVNLGTAEKDPTAFCR